MNRYSVFLTSGENVEVEAHFYQYPKGTDVYDPVHFFGDTEDPIHTFNLGVVAYILTIGQVDG